MDVIFSCPKCDQELAVDSSGAGSAINCPACGAPITIPEAPPSVPRAGVPHAAPPAEGHPVNPISTSAAAKVEMHLKVPVHNAPSESLITKALAPLDVAAKESDRKIKVKTIRHTDCIEVGHDKFDEVVTNFLQKVGEAGLISLTPLTYTHLDIGSQKIMTEFGVLIVYRG
jgi:DNA-directed RNA polymerase subunit RPC12/RpoP